MNILFLTQVLPYPLDAGPKVRAYYVLRYLAQHHAVTLASFVRATDQPAAIDHLRQYCRSVHTIPMPRSRGRDARALLASLVTRQPFLIQRDWQPAMAAMLREVVRQEPFDAIHADQLWMAPYALAGRTAAAEFGPSPMVVLDQHNAVYRIPERMAEGVRFPPMRAMLAREARQMLRFEIETCGQFDHVVWVTQEDHRAVQAQAARRGSSVPLTAIIPICGDAMAVAPVWRLVGSRSDRSDGSVEGSRPEPVEGSSVRRVTFLGGLHYPPNAQGLLWFVAHIWPEILRQVPDARLTVIGKNPPPELAQAGANVDVTGYVTDPLPYLEETAAFVVPLLAGGGMRVKILDAWLWGLPVVSTTIGAEGITTRPGDDILIADAPEAFAAAVVRVLTEPDLAGRLAAAGRSSAERHYDWRQIYTAWDQIYGS